MFCKFCGKEVADDAKFCPVCGGIATEEETYAIEAISPVFDPNLEKELKSRAKKSVIFGVLGLVFGFIIGLILAFIGKVQVKKYALLNGGIIDGKAKVGNTLCTIGVLYGILTCVCPIVWWIMQMFNIIVSFF